MLSCKNCGAQMSGIDLVCKKCGTPWGKKHKSRKKIYLSIFAIVVVAIGSYIYFTPNIDKTPLVEMYNKYFASNKNRDEEIGEDITPSTSPEAVSPSPIISTEPSPSPIETTSPSPSPEPPVILPPIFNSVTASSSLASQGNFSYKPNLTLDGKMTTAWLEGVKGNGIGEWIMFSNDKPQTVSYITLYNGYLKNNTTYLNNGRIKKFSLEFSDGSILTYDIAKVTFNESKNGYVINFDTPISTTSIKLTVLDVYNGAYYADLALSEIKFN